MAEPRPYTTNQLSSFRPGDRIRFRGPNGKIVEDTVRQCFWQVAYLEPYARNVVYPALVLTEHSWTAESNVIATIEDKERRQK